MTKNLSNGGFSLVDGFEMADDRIIVAHRYPDPMDRAMADVVESFPGCLPSDAELERRGVDRAVLARELERGMDAETFTRALHLGLDVDAFNNRPVHDEFPGQFAVGLELFIERVGGKRRIAA